LFLKEDNKSSGEVGLFAQPGLLLRLIVGVKDVFNIEVGKIVIVLLIEEYLLELPIHRLLQKLN